MERQEGIDKVRELMKDARICMLTSMTEDGRHVSRPMGLQEAEFVGDLWFFTYEDSEQTRNLVTHPQVNVSFSNQKDNAWVSLSGAAELVHDRAKAEKLWTPFLKAWFPDGLDTGGLVLIKVNAESAEYWDSPGGKALALFGAIKAAVTGKPPKAGDNEVVEL
jgi:general stress protein 26